MLIGVWWLVVVLIQSLAAQAEAIGGAKCSGLLTRALALIYKLSTGVYQENCWTETRNALPGVLTRSSPTKQQGGQLVMVMWGSTEDWLHLWGWWAGVTEGGLPHWAFKAVKERYHKGRQCINTHTLTLSSSLRNQTGISLWNTFPRRECSRG